MMNKGDERSIVTGGGAEENVRYWFASCNGNVYWFKKINNR